jgi:hypothetical protein
MRSTFGGSNSDLFSSWKVGKGKRGPTSWNQPTTSTSSFTCSAPRR